MFRFKVSNGFAVAFMAIVVLLIAGPTVGWAQIEEIVVTTRKREESLQDVPISVGAFTEQDIRRQGITDVADISKYSPSVTFDTGYNPTDTRVNIRGLSATRGRSNVAFLIDGIDVTTENMIAAGSGLLASRRLLNDVERIEVVKGSQSALYGRAAFSGAISYITKEPGDEFEGDLRLDMADDGYFEMGGAVGGPVIGIEDVLGFRLNGIYWEDDGSYQNSVSGENVGGGKGWGTSLTLVYTPTDRLKFKTRFEFSDDEFDPQAIVRLTHDTPLPYPEDAFLVGLAGGTSRDLVNSDEGHASSGQGASTESNAVVSLRDHGLYCGDVLPDTLTADQREERQLLLMQMFPDFPRVSANFVADNYTPDPGVDQPDIPLSLQQIDDGTGNLVQPLFPGWCNARSFGDAGGKEVTHSENPLTGREHDGSEVETFRASMLATYDLDFGAFSLNMGFTDSDSSTEQDQIYAASGRPDSFLTAQGANSATNTEQTSIELRFASNWEDSPIQVTVGGLYWDEERETNDQNYIINCLDTGRSSLGGIVTNITGLCDGGTPPAGFFPNVPGPTLDSYQAFRRQLEPHPGSTWQADTEHTSIYTNLEFELAETLTLTLEDRYVDEDFDINRPNQSSCTNLAFSIGGGTIVPAIGPWLDEAQDSRVDNRCTSDQFDLSTGPVFFRDLPTSTHELYLDSVIAEPGDTQQDLLDKLVAKHGDVLMPGNPLIMQPDDPLFRPQTTCLPLAVDANCAPWGNIIGSSNSKFHTPKVTLQWMPTDDAMLYVFWAKAQKPGGINQLAAGGSATTIDQERFDPEKMDTYEFGWKMTWEEVGVLFNGAVFFLDYTDKQVGTQILVPDGQGGFRSNPRVINASSAEVWGLELEATWQADFFEGLVFSGAYTFLDTQYTDFVDETTTFIRAAMAGNCPVVWKDGDGNTVATGVADPNLDDTLYPVADRTFDTTTSDLNPIFAPKCALDLSGNELERAPKHAFVGNVSLTRPFLSTGFDWFTQLNAIFQDERFMDQDNFVKFEEYWVFDFQLGLSSDKLDVLFYVDNLFDEDTLKSGGSGPDFGAGIRDRGFSACLVQTQFFGALPPPRIFGVRLNIRFGSEG